MEVDILGRGCSASEEENFFAKRVGCARSSKEERAQLRQEDSWSLSNCFVVKLLSYKETDLEDRDEDG